MYSGLVVVVACNAVTHRPRTWTSTVVGGLLTSWRDSITSPRLTSVSLLLTSDRAFASHCHIHHLW